MFHLKIYKIKFITLQPLLCTNKKISNMFLVLKKSGLIYLAIAFVLFIQVSCDLSGESNYSPQLTLVSLPKLQNGDTLKIKNLADTEELLLDTITVGDTVSFFLLLNGYSNNLTSFYINQSSDSISRILLPEKATLDSFFVASSDYKNGKFLFQPNIKALYFPFSYVARAVTKTSKFSIHVFSDANFEMGVGGSNTASFSIRTPIKAASISQK